MNKIKAQLTLLTVVITLLSCNIAFAPFDSEYTRSYTQPNEHSSDQRYMRREKQFNDEIRRNPKSKYSNNEINNAYDKTTEGKLKKQVNNAIWEGITKLFKKPKQTVVDDENTKTPEFKPTKKGFSARAIDWLNKTFFPESTASDIMRSKANGTLDSDQQKNFDEIFKKLSTKGKERVANAWADERIAGIRKLEAQIEIIKNSKLPSNQKIHEIDALRKQIATETKTMDHEMITLSNELQKSVSSNEVVIPLTGKILSGIFKSTKYESKIFEIVDMSKIDPTKSIQEQYAELKSTGFFGQRDATVSSINASDLLQYYSSWVAKNIKIDKSESITEQLDKAIGKDSSKLNPSIEEAITSKLDENIQDQSEEKNAQDENKTENYDDSQDITQLPEQNKAIGLTDNETTISNNQDSDSKSSDNDLSNLNPTELDNNSKKEDVDKSLHNSTKNILDTNDDKPKTTQDIKTLPTTEPIDLAQLTTKELVEILPSITSKSPHYSYLDTQIHEIPLEDVKELMSKLNNEQKIKLIPDLNPEQLHFILPQLIESKRIVTLFNDSNLLRYITPLQIRSLSDDDLKTFNPSLLRNSQLNAFAKYHFTSLDLSKLTTPQLKELVYQAFNLQRLDLTPEQIQTIVLAYNKKSENQDSENQDSDSKSSDNDLSNLNPTELDNNSKKEDVDKSLHNSTKNIVEAKDDKPKTTQDIKTLPKTGKINLAQLTTKELVEILPSITSETPNYGYVDTQIHKIPLEDVKELMSKLNNQQKIKLIPNLNPEQLHFILPQLIESKITVRLLAKNKSNLLNSITPLQIRSLSDDDLKTFNPSLLGNSQLNAFAKYHFTSLDLNKLTTSQLNDLFYQASSLKALKLTPEQIQTIEQALSANQDSDNQDSDDEN